MNVKGKTDKKQLAPLMRKSMLTVLGLSIALQVGASLPQANADAGGNGIVISQPVLNDDISWLNTSSKALNNTDYIMNHVPINVLNDEVISIDLSSHFPEDFFSNINVYTEDSHVARVFESSGILIVEPLQDGEITISLSANYIDSEEKVTDQIKLYISKKGDANYDGKVNSTDATQILSHIRNEIFRRSYNQVELNRMDVNRDGKVKLDDAHALMQGYTKKELGAKDNHYILTFQQIEDGPYALHARLSGDLKVGSTVTGNYEYWDLENSHAVESHTEFQWYWTDDQGVEHAIAEATSREYLIRPEDEGRQLSLKITPRSNYGGEGKPVTVTASTPVSKPESSVNVLSLSPGDGANGVSTFGMIEITYDKMIHTHQPFIGFVIKDATTGDVVASYNSTEEYVINGENLIIFLKDLEPYTKYSVEIPANFLYFDNGDGSLVEGPSIGTGTGKEPWTFTTRAPN